MNKYRMVEYTMSDGGKRYGVDKKGWFGWRAMNIPYCGLYRKTVYDKRIAESELKSLNGAHIHIVAKREI
ncbi:MAG: hypothetical protein ACRC5T_10830 [Cetobacterium sp.]